MIDHDMITKIRVDSLHNIMKLVSATHILNNQQNPSRNIGDIAKNTGM